MRIFKRTISFVIIFILLLSNIKNIAFTTTNATLQNPIKIAVFLNSFNDQFISTVKKSLEDIQKENENKVQFTFFDANRNQGIQNQSIEESFDENFDLFVVNPVSTNLPEVQAILDKIIQKNIPMILYFPPIQSLISIIKPNIGAVAIDTISNEAGILQGEILAKTWNNNKEVFDKNKDNIMQYIIFKGPSNNEETKARSLYSIKTLNEDGIKTEQLLSVTCNWDEKCAQTSMDSALLRLDDKIEAIISNNDAMAIGAIKALQKYGYNKGGNSKYIPVVGVDALPEAQELIKQGEMTGTVVQDPREHANAIYNIGKNLISGAYPLAGTNYKFDQSGTTIRLPYYEYIK